MAYVFDDYVIEHVFNKFDHPLGHTVLWASSTGGGWIILWEDGQHIHTYLYPPDILM